MSKRKYTDKKTKVKLFYINIKIIIIFIIKYILGEITLGKYKYFFFIK